MEDTAKADIAEDVSNEDHMISRSNSHSCLNKYNKDVEIQNEYYIKQDKSNTNEQFDDSNFSEDDQSSHFEDSEQPKRKKELKEKKDLSKIDLSKI